MTDPILVDQLVRSYGDTRAVDGLDLVVRDSEVYGFIGPNGAGKTTTLRVLCTLLAPTSGVVRVAGINVEYDPHGVRRKIGVALQESGLDGMQTGREMLLFHGRLQGLRGADLLRGVERSMSCLGIDSVAESRVSALSGGMKRRLDVAIALVHSPSILFLDEPTVGLDPTSRRTLWEEIRRLQTEEGTTVFLTTQYLEEADELADRIGIIAAGKLKTEGTPIDLKRALQRDVLTVTMASHHEAQVTELIEHAKKDQATIAAKHSEGTVTIHSTNGDRTMAVLLKVVGTAGIRIADISLRRPTLDDVFQDLTTGLLADRN